MKTSIGKTFRPLLCTVFVLGVAGCTNGLLRVTYPNIRPVSPQPLADTFSTEIRGSVDPTVTVESTTPTLKWMAKDGIRNYDVAVWICPTRNVTGMFAPELGERVFFASAVQGDSIKITPALKSKQRFYWSVRPSGTEPWSTYNIYNSDFLYHTRSSKGQYFKFLTP